MHGTSHQSTTKANTDDGICGADAGETDAMELALAAAASVRTTAAPNPWVGAVVVAPDGAILATGATEPVGRRHAEIVALEALAAGSARGATLYATLEPCSHHGRTPPCVDAIIEAGVHRVVVGVLDPDPRVAGTGVAKLRAAGIDVTVGTHAKAIIEQLRPYLHQRRTGRPLVIAKIAGSLDGGTAAVDGSSKWITSEESRADGHRLRAESGVILVGAGTVRIDDPALTVRHVEGLDPERVVIGSAPPDARVHPCREWSGSLDDLLDELGGEGVLQVLVEGGATLIRSMLDDDLIDRVVVYLAPKLFTGTDAHPLVGGPTAASIADIWQGRFESVDRIGPDIRIEMLPASRFHSSEPKESPCSPAS